MSSLGKLFSKRTPAPLKEKRPFARRLSSYEARSFRGEDPDDLAPPDAFAVYKPPSVFADHKVIVIVFALVCLGLTAYWIKSVRSARAVPPPVQSVYIEMVQPQTTPPP